MIQGIRNGLFLCGETVIPSLFPLMVVSDYLIRSGVGIRISRPVSPLIEKAFKLPGCSSCAILMGLIGGFPIGAKMITQLYELGYLSQQQSKRMLWFCVNSGPAFIIGAVGVSMLADKKSGILIFLSQTITSLLIGFSSRFFSKENFQGAFKSKKTINPSVLTESVSSSTEAMLNICAWILLFSSVCPFIEKLAKMNPIFKTVVIISEVTNGCSYAAKFLPVFFLSAVVSWSGFAVHMQLLNYLKKIGMSIIEFWLSRIINCLVSLAISYVLFKLFPCEAQVFSTFSEIVIKPYSVSVPAAVAMLVLGAFTILDINLATDKKI